MQVLSVLTWICRPIMAAIQICVLSTISLKKLVCWNKSKGFINWFKVGLPVAIWQKIQETTFSKWASKFYFLSVLLANYKIKIMLDEKTEEVGLGEGGCLKHLALIFWSIIYQSSKIGPIEGRKICLKKVIKLFLSIFGQISCL